MGIADDLRRRFGFSPRQDANAAEEYMRDLSRRPEPEARLARDIAHAMVPDGKGRRSDPDGLVRLALPALLHDPQPLPVEPNARRMYIARTALDAIERHVSGGSDEGLVPELGRAARTETLRSMHPSQMHGRSLDATLASASEKRARTVAAYLSDGKPIADHMERLLGEIPKRGETAATIDRLRDAREFHSRRRPDGGPELRAWVRDGLGAERTMARAGLIEPERVVRIADRVMRGADVETMSTMSRARPDFDTARALGPEGRKAAFAREAVGTESRAPGSAGVAPPSRQQALAAQVARSQQFQR